MKNKIIEFIGNQKKIWTARDMKEVIPDITHIEIREAINSLPELRYMYIRGSGSWRAVRYFAPLGMTDDEFRQAVPTEKPSRATMRYVKDGAKEWEKWQL